MPLDVVETLERVEDSIDGYERPAVELSKRRVVDMAREQTGGA